MKNLPLGKNLILAALLLGIGLTGMGCTEEELSAVLAGVEVAAHELNDGNEDVSFRDWLSSELED